MEGGRDGDLQVATTLGADPVLRDCEQTSHAILS
jgi:hypothetical protein